MVSRGTARGQPVRRLRTTRRAIHAYAITLNATSARPSHTCTDAQSAARMAAQAAAPPFTISGKHARHVMASFVANDSGETACILLNLHDEEVDVDVERNGRRARVRLAAHESRLIGNKDLGARLEDLAKGS